MPINSLLDLESLSSEKIHSLFNRALKLERQPEPLLDQGATAALLFFEPSTRTRMSFEVASHRMGLGAMVLDQMMGTSLEKGESMWDTALNVEAMGPRLMIIRAPQDFPMKDFVKAARCSVVNAGWGATGHPTQALLDALTLKREFLDLKNLKVLFVGDIRHSRVVASHFEILEKLGAEIGLSGPDEFLVDRPGALLFRRIEEGLAWCDAVVALRVQVERHGSTSSHDGKSLALPFRIDARALTHLRSKGVVLHPGPVNWGIELHEDIRRDSRLRILQQVSHGVLLREALMRSLLEGRL